jgi:hypothetical protein
MAIPISTWIWYGRAGHLCIGEWCRFHLTTQVGKYLVSTVGLWVPHIEAPNEREDAAFLKKNPNGKMIGHNRFYETMVFSTTKHACLCGCDLPVTNNRCDDYFSAYNNQVEARKGHMIMCNYIAKLKGNTNGTM